MVNIDGLFLMFKAIASIVLFYGFALGKNFNPAIWNSKYNKSKLCIPLLTFIFFLVLLLMCHALHNRIGEENITPVVKDEAESARLAGFGQTAPMMQRVFVHEDEYDKAKAVFKAAICLNFIPI